MDSKEIDLRFTYHPPNEEQAKKYVELRDAGHALAMLIDSRVPDSREQSIAITKLEECISSANAGIARRS